MLWELVMGLRHLLGAAVAAGIAIAAAALPPSAVGNAGGKATNAGTATRPAASAPAPVTHEDWVYVYGGEPTPEDAKQVSELVERGCRAPAADRDAGEYLLQRTVNGRAFPLVAAAVERKDLPEDGRQWLRTVVERERPWLEARARLALRRRETNEWNIRTAIADYERVGHHDPRWDDVARRGIRGFTARGANPTTSSQLLKQAIDAGCDDPLVAYYYARRLATVGEPPEACEQYLAAAERMLRSTYPPIRKQYAVLRAVEYVADYIPKRAAHGWPLPPDMDKRFHYLGTQLFKYWPAVALDPKIPEDYKRELAIDMISLQPAAANSREAFLKPIMGPLERGLPPDDATPLAIRGRYYIRWAWDARGNGFADTVTPEGWKLMRERLGLAGAALEAAWERDPSDSAVARDMITVAMGLDWSREKMEVWYARAMAADPDNDGATADKLYYLEPKWHGSAEEMIRFGHECLASRNWLCRVPYAILKVHRSLAKYVNDADAYWRQPAVWADLQALFATPLKALPDDPTTQSAYAYWACHTGHWEVAAPIFQKLGDTVDAGVFDSRAQLDQWRTEAKAHSAAGRGG